ncbi:hypothetical protein Tco_0155663 [Tanacetum coccineum]
MPPLQSELDSPKIKGSLNADEDIDVDEVSSAIDGVFDMGESNVESMEVRSKFGEFSENNKSVEKVVGGGKVLGVGEDDDSGNAATDGGDDAVESGDISILNSLIGHESPRSSQLCRTIGTTDVQVLIDKGVDKEVQYYVYTLHVLIPFLKHLNDKYVKKKKTKAAMKRRLWDLGIKIIYLDITLRTRWFLKNTCNNDKNLSEIQLEHEKEDELVVVVVKVSLGKGDDFGVDVLRFHTCLTDILGFLEKFGWWFEQDNGGESEDDRERSLVMVSEEGWMS